MKPEQIRITCRKLMIINVSLKYDSCVGVASRGTVF